MERLYFHEDSPVLTADDVAAMQDADSVSFHFYEGKFFVRCHMDDSVTSTPRIYTAKQQRVFPFAESREYNGVIYTDRERKIFVRGMCHGYTGSLGMWTATPDNYPNATAFDMVHSARYAPEWRSIVSLLRPGHRFGILFTADNNTDTVREAGLHIDMLSVHIGMPKQNRVLSFLLSVSTCKDNTARMVKRNGVYNPS